MIIFCAFLFAISCHQISAGVRELTTDELKRLKSWTENDTQSMWELSGQYEGDMVMEPVQRNAVNNQRYRWPNNEIPYEIDPAFSYKHKDRIEEALSQFSDQTCLKVRPKTSRDRDYVYVTAKRLGCWSSVGRTGGMQELSLSPPGCVYTGAVVHEFLHAAGFLHQQSDPDRDKYVQIVWSNIRPGFASNFDKCQSCTSYGVGYDYESVMHYSSNAFSVNGRPTIIPKEPNARIGQTYGLTAKDAAKVNIMYGCPKQ